ncbi:hypothetical protein BD410DRAFT_781664 [Rickenella mellea]|uniref:Uncharacterized protein n=1 Tax=Rickenella mellea TaxID=50990 RepID=A0A4Y7QLI3_9AGAM|nr:hypothetical protein BD410DRAFT_781664 [Rickenella mellea]
MAKLVSRECKDVRSLHADRQVVLKRSDRRKNQDTTHHKKAWKLHKGHGTRSGRPECIGRNYGIRTGEHIAPQTVFRMEAHDETATYEHESDNESDVETGWPEERRMDVSLLDIARVGKPKRTRNGFELVSPLPRVRELPEVSDFENNMFEDDLEWALQLSMAEQSGAAQEVDDWEWEDLSSDAEQPRVELTYAQMTKVEAG